MTRKAPIVPPDTHTLPIRIYFESTDIAGIVYHTEYIKFLERGRTEFLRESGIQQYELQKKNLLFAMHKINLTYHKPATLDDLINVHTKLEKLDGASVYFKQWITRNNLLLVDANARIALINQEMKPQKIPPFLLHILNPLKACS